MVWWHNITRRGKVPVQVKKWYYGIWNCNKSAQINQVILPFIRSIPSFIRDYAEQERGRRENIWVSLVKSHCEGAIYSLFQVIHCYLPENDGSIFHSRHQNILQELLPIRNFSVNAIMFRWKTKWNNYMRGFSKYLQYNNTLGTKLIDQNTSPFMWYLHGSVTNFVDVTICSKVEYSELECGDGSS